MADNLKDMSAEEIRRHIRTLEKKTRTKPMSNEDFNAMTFFDCEDYVIKLEKERAFSAMSPES
jgi:hypothetical protein